MNFYEVLPWTEIIKIRTGVEQAKFKWVYFSIIERADTPLWPCQRGVSIKTPSVFEQEPPSSMKNFDSPLRKNWQKLVIIPYLTPYWVPLIENPWPCLTILYPKKYPGNISILQTVYLSIIFKRICNENFRYGILL